MYESNFEQIDTRAEVRTWRFYRFICATIKEVESMKIGFKNLWQMFQIGEDLTVELEFR